MGKRRPDRLRHCRTLCGDRCDYSALSHPGQRQGDKRATGLHVLKRSDVEVPRTFAAGLRKDQSRSGRIRSVQKLCEPHAVCVRRNPERLRHTRMVKQFQRGSQIPHALSLRGNDPGLRQDVFSEDACVIERYEKALPELAEELARCAASIVACAIKCLADGIDPG